MKVLVTGKGGQLASEFENLMNSNHNWTFVSAIDLNITNLKSVLNYFSSNNYDLIINCAAYTAVDEAEQEKELAYSVNAYGTKNLIEACEINNTKLIHYSTDYIFDGKSKKPYVESDNPNPNSVYGASKLLGEEFIIQNDSIQSIIFRTSWVYSSFGNNFVKNMLRLTKERKELGVVGDQIGSPTYARDLAEDTLKVILNQSYNWKCADIFHYSNNGSCSWFEFARKIFEIKKIDIDLKELLTDEYPTKAIRPKYSLLDKRKFQSTFSVVIKNWENSLEEMLYLV
jgi:dTDP-4-dehydrorhamnose reductase